MLFVTNSLGEELAENINFSVNACRGLIKLSIKEEFPLKDIEELSLDDFNIVFDINLRRRLKQLQVDNADNIIDDLILKLLECKISIIK